MLKGTGHKYEQYSQTLKRLLREKEMEIPQAVQASQPPPQQMMAPSQAPIPAQMQQYVPPEPTNIQMRPGTSRMGRKVPTKQVDEGDEWANQDIDLP